ncbi:MAG TPA: sigma-70 family RNA polymerase sigma factor [Polyangia bacterium]|nr:sigma-70 family RNA polymerase sigma factor [Polyangia bacterium]
MKLVRDHRQEPAEPSGGTPPGPSLFDDVYVQHFGFVWRCLRGLGVPQAALDDAAQDVFLAVHRQLGRFRGEAGIRTWLYGIARHIASNHRRRDRRKMAPLEPLDPDTVARDPDPLQRAADAQAASFIEQFLAKLDTKKREVFLLAMIEEMTIPEVAAALSIPLNTAYTRFRRVRAEFHRALARVQHAAR